MFLGFGLVVAIIMIVIILVTSAPLIALIFPAVFIAFCGMLQLAWAAG